MLVNQPAQQRRPSRPRGISQSHKPQQRFLAPFPPRQLWDRDRDRDRAGKQPEVRVTGYPLPFNPELSIVYPVRTSALYSRTFGDDSPPDLLYLASPASLASLGFQVMLQLRQQPPEKQVPVICNFQTDLSGYWLDPLPPAPLSQMAVFESMASGVPVVARDEGGPSDILRHGFTGLLVPPGDVDGFVAGAVKLATSGPSPPPASRHLIPVYGWLMMNSALREAVTRSVIDARLMGGLGIIITFWAVTGCYVMFAECLLWAKGRMRTGERKVLAVY